MALTQVNSEGIKDGEIKDADVNASAAIAKSKLASLDIVNADVNASAAIAGSKLAAATTSAAGSMSAADKTKLDGVATSATANPSAPALTGSTNNQITTVTGANAIQGEANLTFDGSTLSVGATGEYQLILKDTNNTGNAAEAAIGFKGNDDATLGLIGPNEWANGDFKVNNSTNGGDIVFETHNGTVNTERLRIDANGIITPKPVSGVGGISMVGAFMAQPTASYDFTAGAAVITLADEQFDANGWYDTSNYRYTPLCKGWYQINMHLQFLTGLNNNAIEMQLNPKFNGAVQGGAVHGWDDNFGNYGYVSLSKMIYFDGVDDYLEMQGTSSHTTDVSVHSFMSGFLVHPIA